VARKGNECITDQKVLEHVAREILDEKCNRTMAILEPLRLTIRNLPAERANQYLSIPNHPKDQNRGNRQVLVSEEVWIDQKDWRDEDSKN